MIRRSDRFDHGQSVGEALVVEERTSKKLSIVSAACAKQALSMMRVVAEVPSMEMEEIDGR